MRSFSGPNEATNQCGNGCCRSPKANGRSLAAMLKVQYCWPIGKPLVGNLGNGLWEVRSNLQDRIVRVLFCVEGKKMILLHGFIKKTQKTPKQELDLALRRKNQLKD